MSEQDQKKIGILNTGKNNQFIDNTFFGHDIGIKDEGENTFAKGNKFDTDTKNTKKWYDKWWIKYIIFPVSVGLIIWLITQK